MNRQNILILTQWSFKDALVQTYTLPYVHIIRRLLPSNAKIFVLTAENSQMALTQSELSDINSDWAKRNMQLIAQPYQRFGWRKMINSITHLFRSAKLIRKEKIGTIHAFCTPAGGIGYLLSKLTGAKLIIDSYEPHAESMVENGTWKKGGVAHRTLWKLEKLQTRKAAHLIATTEGMRQYARDNYSADPKSFFVKPACVDLNKFSHGSRDIELERSLELSNKIVCVYAGKIGGIYLTDEVFMFVKACFDRWGDTFRFLMLSNLSTDELHSYMAKFQIPRAVIIQRFVPHNEVPRYLSLGNFALNPVKPVPTKRFCTSIKDGEYWAMGLPVVISPNISDDSNIIERENIGVVVDLSDVQQTRKAIDALASMLENDQALRDRIRSIAERYRSYSIAESIYQKIYSAG